MVESTLQLHNDPAFVNVLQNQWQGDYSRDAKDIIRGLTRDFDNINNIVLDVGCGSGRMAEIFEHAHYRGLDSSNAFVDICRYKKLTVNSGSVYYTLMSTASMDLVICNAVLFHIGDFATAVKELWRITRKRLIFSVYYSKWQWKHKGAQPALVEDRIGGHSWWAVTNVIPRWQIKRFVKRKLTPQPKRIQFKWLDGKPEGSCWNIAFVILDKE